jgi:hypothetical protein
MGKLATVVYDAVQHVPLVMRTRTSSPAERYGVIDAVAAFAHHCESLRGVARSNVHVSALWGGPPFLTYQVVQSRYRVIVMWVDTPGDLDISQDVQDALVRLHGSVAEVADGMIAGDPGAIAHAYAIAGAVLEDDYVHALSLASSSKSTLTKKSSLAGAALGALPGRSGSGAPSFSSAPEPVSKKSGFLRGLLKGGGKVRRSDSSSKQSDADDGESNALSALSPVEGMPFGEHADLPSVLKLPEEVFAFSDFGAPLPKSAGNLAWVADLIQGHEKPKSQPRPPALRVLPPASSTTSPAVGPAAASPQLSDASTAAAAAAAAPVPSPPSATGNPRLQSAAIAMAPPSTQSVPSASSVHSSAAAYAPPDRRTPQAAATVPPQAAPTPAAELATGVPEQLRDRGDDADADFDVAALGGVRDEAAAVSASASDRRPGADGGSGLPTATSDAIRTRMNEFANSMQNGNYPLALQQVVATLRGLSKIQPRPERETVACASYFQALQILIRVRVLEDEMASVMPNSTEAMRRTVEMALQTMFLAEMKNLLPRHAVAGKKMAVEKNVAAGNFGMSARWLRTLVEAAPPPQKPAFAQRLELCVRNRELNAHMPPSKWLCFNSLTAIPQQPLMCNFCPAVFSPAGDGGVLPDQPCPVCHSGSVQLWRDG